MAKEVAISKLTKISEAQQYMLLAVLGTALVLGVTIALTSHISRQISFNTKVIMEAEKSIADYSNIIKSTGVCEAPKGSIYSDSELEKCNPESIEISQINGTLRANILGELANNEALNSTPKGSSSECLNSNGTNYTYKELEGIYKQARGAEELQSASALIRSCSALRVIPDALPAFKNEDALLASLNKLYLVANWEPESISSSGTSEVSKLGTGLNEILVNSRIEADFGTAITALNNIERSIRDFDMRRVNIEWNGSSSVDLQFEAAAYYMDKSSIVESEKTISAEGK